MDKLEQARNIIREADKEMAALFEKRMHAARMVAEYKIEHGLPVYDAAQEARVIERNTALIEDETLKDFYVEYIQNTMAVSRSMQHRIMEGMRVAYSGVEGAFAHIAARNLFPDGKHISLPSFEAAYEAVVKGECDCAVLPIENSYTGEVGQVVDMMFSGSLYVNGIYDLPITQHLLGCPGAIMTDITQVVSHPQALAQCHAYIQKKGYREITAENTALAAKRVAEAGDIHTAAIASLETAQLYGLQVLDHDIHESKTNTTRFAIFARSENKPAVTAGHTFILMFTVKHQAGELAKAISVIGRYGFNMKVLRSRPMKTLPWQYYFYAEAEGDEDGAAAKFMLNELSEHCAMLKVVGCYKA
ncbi:MAG: chorismate mutase [Clostridia bacterium]|nr:chorismate mutase [Clostridia bacterium]